MIKLITETNEGKLLDINGSIFMLKHFDENTRMLVTMSIPDLARKGLLPLMLSKGYYHWN